MFTDVILAHCFKILDSNAIKTIEHILLTNFMAKNYVEWVLKFAKLLIIHALCNAIYAYIVLLGGAYVSCIYVEAALAVIVTQES